MSFTGLVEASPELRADVDGSLAVCDSFTVEDIPDWKRALIPANDPEVWGLRREFQKRNDCQPTAIGSGLEVIEWRTKRRKGEIATSWLYNACELEAYGGVGMNQGTPIQSGIKVLKRDGAPLESERPYGDYTKSVSQFKAWSTPEVMASAATRKLAKATPSVPFETAFALAILGQPTHWGIYWPIQIDANRVAKKYHGNHGGGGHALELVFGRVLPSGEKQIKMANSHNDGYIWITEQFYEEARDPRATPYGAYVLYGTDDPIANHVNWLTEGFRG